MSLADKLLEFQTWSTARKTAQIYRIAVPTGFALLVLTHLGFRGNDAIDLWQWDLIVLLTVAVNIATLVVCELTVRAGREGRWTIYAAILSFGVCVSLMVNARPVARRLSGLVPAPHRASGDLVRRAGHPLRVRLRSAGRRHRDGADAGRSMALRSGASRAGHR